MTVFGAAVNQDSAGTKTSARYGDRGDGTTEWFQTQRTFDGGDVAVGARADAAATDAAATGTLLAFVKGLHTRLAALVTAVGEPGAAATNATTTALAASLVVKASAGRLWGLQGVNTGPDQYVHVYNSATVPADTAVPVVVVWVPTGSNFSIDFGRRGRSFATGIAVANSSTAATKTVGAADLWVDAQYT